MMRSSTPPHTPPPTLHAPTILSVSPSQAASPSARRIDRQWLQGRNNTIIIIRTFLAPNLRLQVKNNTKIINRRNVH